MCYHISNNIAANHGRPTIRNWYIRDSQSMPRMMPHAIFRVRKVDGSRLITYGLTISLATILNSLSLLVKPELGLQKFLGNAPWTWSIWPCLHHHIFSKWRTTLEDLHFISQPSRSRLIHPNKIQTRFRSLVMSNCSRMDLPKQFTLPSDSTSNTCTTWLPIKK